MGAGGKRRKGGREMGKGRGGEEYLVKNHVCGEDEGRDATGGLGKPESQ